MVVLKAITGDLNFSDVESSEESSSDMLSVAIVDANDDEASVV